MRPFLPQLLAVFCATLLLHNGIHAQVTSASMTVNGEPVAQMPNREQEPIFRGAEYLRYPYVFANGIACYKTDDLTPGNITYYGRNYQNVPLVYDQITDEVITVGISGNVMLRLYGPEIETFSINGGTFVYFTDTVEAHKQGFWEILVNGRTKLLKRELKVVKTRIINSKMARTLQPQLYYRVFKNGLYHEVQDKEQMMTLFADKSSQLKPFLKSNRRRFRRGGFETMLQATTVYYNEITAS